MIPGRGEDPALSLQQQLETLRGERLWVVHRLDRDTSGVLVFARTAEAHRDWSIAFSEGRVEKEYLAFTAGSPKATNVRVHLIEEERGRMRVADKSERGAKASETRISVVRRWAAHDICLVRCTPLTGRTHQIRVHLAHVGAPLLADPFYGERQTSWPMDRTALHAAKLIGPPSVGGIEIGAPLPRDFVELLRALG